jgi:hypothetical protein
MNRLLATLASALDEIEVQLKAARTASTGSCAPRRSR